MKGRVSFATFMALNLLTRSAFYNANKYSRRLWTSLFALLAWELKTAPEFVHNKLE